MADHACPAGNTRPDRHVAIEGALPVVYQGQLVGASVSLVSSRFKVQRFGICPKTAHDAEASQFCGFRGGAVQQRLFGNGRFLLR